MLNCRVSSYCRSIGVHCQGVVSLAVFFTLAGTAVGQQWTRSGPYFLRLTAGAQSATRKITLTK
ncbi:MAG: hypothetical protein MAG453_01111 [Calditrichaeota bacterium]|nr:hypothetical protein [Calditrichota bacterium]